MLKKVGNDVLDNFLGNCNYSKKDLEYIKKNFEKEFNVCILRQIYAKLGMIQDKDNEYLKLLKLIKQRFSLDCKVLDACCGHLPILSDYIRKEQIKIGRGTITALDPKLVVSSYEKINKLVKSPFDGTIVKGYDLIISQAPCSMFDSIVCSCLENNKAFFVTVCGCNNKTDYLTNKNDPFDVDDYDPILDTIYSYIFNIIKNKRLNYDKFDYDTRDGFRYFYGIPKKKIK